MNANKVRRMEREGREVEGVRKGGVFERGGREREREEEEGRGRTDTYPHHTPV